MVRFVLVRFVLVRFVLVGRELGDWILELVRARPTTRSPGRGCHPKATASVDAKSADE